MFCVEIAATQGAALSGTIKNPTGTPLAGPSTVRASNDGGSTTTSDGSYSLTVPSGWSGFLLVERQEATGSAAFTPAYRMYSNVTVNQTVQDFQILPAPPQTISGMVTNSSGQGVVDVLLVATTNGGAALTASNGTYFLGYHAQGPTWSGTVTPQKVDATFIPTHRSFTAINTAQSNQNYTASGDGGESGSRLTLNKTADVSSIHSGQPVTFTLTLTNTSPLTASNTVVQDTLSPWLEFGSAGEGGSYDSGSHTVTWTLGNLTGYSNHVLTLSVTVAAGLPPAVTITNQARVTATGLTNDSAAVTLGQPIPFLPPKRFGGGGGDLGSYSNRVALGIAYERLPVDLATNYFTNPDTIDFSDTDLKVLNAQSNNIRKFGLIAFNGNGTWPAATQLGPVVARYVERYDGDGMDDMPGLTLPIQQWEIFNEYNTNWSGYAGCTEAMYANYLSNAYLAAHAACSNIEVIASAVPTARDNRSEWYLHNLLTNTWVTNYFDGMNYHAYEDYYPFTNGVDPIPYDYLFIRSFKDFLAGYGLADRDLWSTETDFSGTFMETGKTASQTDNARFLARSYPFALASGVDHIFYTELEYVSMAPEPLKWAFLTDSNGNRRAVFYVLQKLIEKLEGFTEASLTDFGGGSLGAHFVFSNTTCWVVWNYSNLTGQVQVPVGTYAQVRVTEALPASFDNTGAVWTVTTNPVTGNFATINANSNAVYVEPFDPLATLTLTSSAGPHGSILPASTNVVDGGNVTFILTAAPYYRILAVTTNGTDTGLLFDNHGTTTNYTWSNVQTTGVLAATFIPQVANDPVHTPYEWVASYYPGTNDFDAAAWSDTDGDGHAAWQEYGAGTNPTNPASLLQVGGAEGIVATTNGFVIRWSSVDNKRYRLERGTNLTLQTPFDSLVKTNILGLAPVNTETDTTAVGMGPWFYRIGVE